MKRERETKDDKRSRIVIGHDKGTDSDKAKRGSFRAQRLASPHSTVLAPSFGHPPSVGQSRYVTVKISELRLGKRDTSVTNKRFFISLHNVFFVKKS